MKKRLFAMILVGLMAVGTSTTAFAAMTDDSYTYMPEYDDSSASTELSYFKGSSYLVKIPLRINDIVNSGYTFTASSIDILDNEVVNVYADSTTITMTSDRGDTCNMELRCSDSSAKPGLMGTFRNGETISSVSMQAQMDMGAKAGSYTGTATFSVKLEPAQ